MSNLELDANVTTEVALAQNTENLNWAEIVATSGKLDKMKKQLTITASYMELEKVGDSFRGVFLGLGTMNVTDKGTGELKSIQAARFMHEGKVYINGGVVLVDEIQKAGIPISTPLEVTYVKKEGNTKIYDVAVLS